MASRGPETQRQARRWTVTRTHYLLTGLCEACAAQAAWGHQLGFKSSARRNWPERDRHIKPPCDCCLAAVNALPVEIPGSPWRKLADRAVRHAVAGQR